jgi:hypothetical protein
MRAKEDETIEPTDRVVEVARPISWLIVISVFAATLREVNSSLQLFLIGMHHLKGYGLQAEDCI